MNTDDFNDNDDGLIDIHDMFLNVAMHWKLIFIIGFLAALCCGAWSYMHSATASTSTVKETEKLGDDYKTKLENYKSNKESVNQAISGLQDAIKNEYNKLQDDPAMQRDPYHVYSDVGSIEIKADKKTDINELALIGQEYSDAAVDIDFLTKEAKKLNTEAQYLQDMINIENSTLMQTSADTQVSSNTSDTDIVASTKVYLMKITVNGTSADNAKVLYNDVVAHIKDEKKSAEKLHDHDLVVTDGTVTVGVDDNLQREQEDILTNISNYNQQILNLTNGKNNILVEPTDDGSSTAAAPAGRSISKKSVLGGLLGGIILLTLYFCVKYIVGKKVKTSNEFKDMYNLNNLGTFKKDFGKKSKDPVVRAVRRKINEAADGDSDTVLEMIYASALAYSAGLKSVSVIGTIKEEKVKEIADNLQKKFAGSETEIIYGGNVVKNPESRKELKDVDGVIFVEGRGETLSASLKKEVEIVKSFDKRNIGVVIF